MGVKLFLYMGGCDKDDDDNDDNDNGSDGGWLILPCVCDVCLQFCWVSVGARKQNCHYHLFIQTRPATRMMIMMITMVAVMVPAQVDLRVIPSSGCDMCLHSYWVSVGVVITISSFKQGPPCKEITWLHDKPTCGVFLSMMCCVCSLSCFTSPSFCRFRIYLLVVTRLASLVILLPLSREILENARLVQF